MPSPLDTVQVTVIGAGVVGLAITRALSRVGCEVLLVDKEGRIGSETSSRNSEVIHAGLYYPPNSRKADWCVRGKHLLYDYCQERSIPHKRVGKLLVGTTAYQRDVTLPKLYQQAVQNGVNNVKIISKADVLTMEPQVDCLAALWSPSTGILDSHTFMYHLLQDAEDHGATLALHTQVQEARTNASEESLELKMADDTWISSKIVINAGGLWSGQVASLWLNDYSLHWQPPRHYFAKGNYFRLSGKPPFTHLIYPVPDERGGLGVHATLDLHSQVKFGPDVEWLDANTAIDQINWNPDPERGQVFYEAIRKYWPHLSDNALMPDYAGVRPKLTHPSLVSSNNTSKTSVGFHDFVTAGPQQHGIPNLYHFFGIESPGLTSAMAIGEYMANLVNRNR
jgi:L-2-hydroxyglutarate oxidase LhgO